MRRDISLRKRCKELEDRNLVLANELMGLREVNQNLREINQQIQETNRQLHLQIINLKQETQVKNLTMWDRLETVDAKNS